MSRGEPPSPRSIRDEEAGTLWARFRDGQAAGCPRDGGLVALSVDSAAKTYRLVCTQCGLSSMWFQPTADGIEIKNLEETLSGSSLSDD